jgi:hypothetical protein
VPALVAVGEAAHKKLIQRCAGDNAELAELRDSVSQAPVGYANAHATLNDFRKLHHILILSQFLIYPALFFEIRDMSGAEMCGFGQNCPGRVKIGDS